MKMDENLFNPSQLRRIKVTLLVFEEALRNADRLLLNENDEGILYSVKTSLSAEQRILLRKKIAETLNYINDFSRVLGLEPMQYSVENSIRGEINLSWEGLEECRPKYLKGFGELTPEAAEFIEPAIDHLIKDTFELTGMLDNDLNDTQKKTKKDAE